MVAVFAYIVEVVVLPTGTNAFLRVGSTFERSKVGGWINSTKEDGLVLVHARIGEEEGRVGEGGRRRRRGLLRKSIGESL